MSQALENAPTQPVDMQQRILDEWERCKGFLEPALDGGYDLDDVRDEILGGTAQLWPLRRSAVVSRIHEYPRCRVFRVWLAGGELNELLAHLGTLDDYAEGLGCSRIEIEGRKGWVRVLRGFNEGPVILTRDL